MDKLALFNILGVGATMLLAVTAAVLGVAAVMKGSAHPISMMPQWERLGPTRAAQLESLTEVLPVVLACYVAHQSLHPLMPLLKPYSPRRMCAVIATALGMVVCIFLLLSVGASVAFGLEVDPNVLNNISEAGMTPLLGPVLADILSLVIRGGYMMSLVANLLLYVHPLRSYISEMIWPEPDDDSTSTTADRVVHIDWAQCPVNEHDVAAGSSPKAADLITRTTGAAPAAGPQVITAAAAVDTLPAVIVDDLAAVQTAPVFQIDPEDHGQQQQQGYVVAADPTEPSTGPAAPPLLRWQQQEQRWYYLLTYALLAIISMCAVCVPNIWAALSAIGDLASTIQAFVIPGAIALVLASHRARVHHASQPPQQAVPQPGPATLSRKPAATASTATDCATPPAQGVLPPVTNLSATAEDVVDAEADIGTRIERADSTNFSALVHHNGFLAQVQPAARTAFFAGRQRGGKGNVLFFSSFRIRQQKVRFAVQERLGLSSGFADWAELLMLRGLGTLVMVLGGVLFINGIVQRIT
jgi:hypothetical protein